MNLKSFLKFLSRNKLYTAINVVGLSVSLMFVILIGIYVVQELSVDRFQQDGDRIYILGDVNKDGSRDYLNALPVAWRVQERYPEVEAACPVVIETMPQHVKLQKGADESLKATLLMADSSFFSFFSFGLKKGLEHRVLESMQSAVVSESFAQRAFGNESPMGRSIWLNDTVSVIVSGVMEDMKPSVIPSSDIVIRVEHLPTFNYTVGLTNYNNAGSTVAFLKLKAGADLSVKLDDMRDWFKTFYWMYAKGYSEQPTLTKLPDVYFSQAGWPLKGGDKRFVLILTSVGLVILIFSIINYINLTMAQSGFRAKEMALRRLLGSERTMLFMRLLFESFVMVLVSFGVGILLAGCFVPFVNDLLQTNISLRILLTPAGIGAMAAVIAVLSVLSGLLPAVMISNTKSIEVVRGTFRRRTKMTFSKVFITLQNVVTIVMIACALTMYLQIRHLIDAPLGYRTENIIDMWNNFDNPEQSSVFRNEVRQLACVHRVAVSQGTPFNRGNNYSGSYEGKNISSQNINGDSTFFSMLGLEIIRNNRLAPGEGAFVNEEFLRQTGLSEEAPCFHYYDREIKIAGVIKDFQMANITHVKEPVFMKVQKEADINAWNILIEVQGDPYEAYREIASVYQRITGREFEGKYIDQQVMDSFDSQRRTAKIVTLFAGIAVLISLLGLLAMSTYFIRQRLKEVAVRKVFGSTTNEVMRRLVRTFLSYVGMAFVVAVPLIWYFMSGWLSDYAYRISLSVWIYLTAFVFCLIISFLTVFWQALRAARTNPVKSLRSE